MYISKVISLFSFFHGFMFEYGFLQFQCDIPQRRFWYLIYLVFSELSGYVDWYLPWILEYALPLLGFSWWLGCKESACSAGATGDVGSIPESGRSPGGGHDNPLQYSCLKNPMNRGAWQVTVHGVTKSQTWLKWLSIHAHTHCHYYFKYLFWPFFSFCVFIICMLHLLQLSHSFWIFYSFYLNFIFPFQFGIFL